ncbi:MAG TPA: sigma-70 family RNA polymerase sigma factor [Candidatus Gastranaerophilaceae bacterium]|nr:sigma-70 family RNA polymerase sigma factor [Candidatus Gastranaerophilaceae bacterium]HPT40941.1 sigma-70 family RNA polymerase sigma factor [Candidatus Gastranaerophilaceae bacterium]
MELAQQKVDLIKKIIKSDKKYLNNEDLFEDFFNESYKRSFLVAKTVENENALETYLRKIITTSIVVVLKDSGRIQRTSEGFVPVKEEPLEVVSQPIIENKYSNIQVSYDIIDLSEGPEEITIKKETLQTLVDAVKAAHKKNPSKQYLELYDLRYSRGLKQKQIAQELNLSQSEVSKRLLELMEHVKSKFNQD